MSTDEAERNRERRRKWRRDNPEKHREEKRRYRERNAEKLAFKKSLARAVRGERFDRERFDAWAAANPEKAAASAKRRRQKPHRKLLQAQAGRRRYIKTHKNRAALDAHIIANARDAGKVVESADMRREIVNGIVAGIYSGRFPIRVTAEHAKEILAEHLRMFTKFGPTSLDAPRFDDGSGSYHDTISEGLWQ